MSQPPSNSENQGPTYEEYLQWRRDLKEWQRNPDGTISARASNLSHQISREMAGSERTDRGVGPTEGDVAALRRYYAAQAQELARRIADIEEFLGFVEHSENLAARVAKIEAFVGLKG
jgi:cell fate (sporulation/competence/biofilm development) regulator YlbF (YheA/YmcA/DUF963 family)